MFFGFDRLVCESKIRSEMIGYLGVDGGGDVVVFVFTIYPNVKIPMAWFGGFVVCLWHRQIVGLWCLKVCQGVVEQRINKGIVNDNPGVLNYCVVECLNYSIVMVNDLWFRSISFFPMP